MQVLRRRYHHVPLLSGSYRCSDPILTESLDMCPKPDGLRNAVAHDHA